MRRVSDQIITKLWNLCNVLKDDGVTYHEYVNELTYLLFLKMARETGVEQDIPEGYRKDSSQDRVRHVPRGGLVRLRRK